MPAVAAPPQTRSATAKQQKTTFSKKQQQVLQQVQERKKRRLSLPHSIASSTSVNPEKVIKRRRQSRRFSIGTKSSSPNHNNTKDRGINDENNSNNKEEELEREPLTHEETDDPTVVQDRSSSSRTLRSSSNRRRLSLPLTNQENERLDSPPPSENRDDTSMPIPQGPTPYYKVVEERGGEMSPRLTRSATKTKRKPFHHDNSKPPLAKTTAAAATASHAERKERCSVFSPPNRRQSHGHESARRGHSSAKSESRMLVFSPPRNEIGAQDTVDLEDSSDLTSDTTETRQPTLSSKQMEALASEIKIVKEQQGALLKANQEARQTESDAQSKFTDMMKETMGLVEQHSALTLELEQVKSERDRFRAIVQVDMEQLAQHNERLEEENTMLVSRQNKDRNHMQELEQNLDQYQQQVHRLEQEMLPASEHELNQARNKLKMQQDKMTELQGQAAEYKEQMTTLQRQLEAATSSVQTLTSETDAKLRLLSDDKQRLEDEHSQMTEDNTNLGDRIQELNSELEKCFQQVTRFEQEEIPALREQLQEAEEKIHAQQTERASLEKELASYQNQVDHLQGQVQTMRLEQEQQSSDVTAEMETIARENEALEQDKEGLLLVHEENQSKIDELSNQVKVLEEKLRDLETVHLPRKQADLDQANENLRAQKLHVTNLEEKLVESERYIVDLQQQLDEMDKKHKLELDELESKNVDNSNALKQLQEEQVAKDQELEQMEIEVSTKEERVKELNDRTQELDDALNETMQQLEESNADLAQMKERMERMEVDAQGHTLSSNQRIQDLERALRKSQQREQALKAEKKTLYQESLKQKDDLEVLETKLHEKTREHDKFKEYAALSGEREKELHEQLMESDQVRRDLHARVMQLMGNIRVFVRVRPMTSEEEEKQEPAALRAGGKGASESKDQGAIFKFPSISDRRTNSTKRNGQKQESFDLTKKAIEVLEPKKDRGGLKDRRARHQFHFDNVFQHQDSQRDVWESTESLVQSTVDGYNVTLFAYGQTGSGKTYTMLGEPGNEGIVTRSIKKLFADKAKLENRTKGKSRVVIKVEIVEIYNENVYDLLSSERKSEGRKSLKVSMVTNNIEGNMVQEIATEDECLELMNLAQNKRCIKSTSSNAESSRSHLVFTIHYIVTEDSGSTRKGKLNICDLAGSERLSKSEAHFVGGALLQETKNINKSLSALSNVIEQLQAGSKTVAYRDSKLTSLLCDSLGGGNSKVLAVICCCPLSTHYHESLSSLRFAEKASKVELKASASGFSC